MKAEERLKQMSRFTCLTASKIDKILEYDISYYHKCILIKQEMEDWRNK